MHLRHCLVVVAALLASATVAGGGQPTQTSNVEPTATASPLVKGTWKVVEQFVRSPGGEWTVGAIPYLSLYIFTDRHYSYMFAPGAAPRRLFAGDGNQPTDAEKVAAYNSFVAGSGTYTLTGSTLTLNAVLHKNPNEMTGHPLKYEVEISGSTLRMTIANAPFAPLVERRIVLARAE
jgi:hypothetical protein